MRYEIKDVAEDIIYRGHLSLRGAIEKALVAAYQRGVRDAQSLETVPDESSIAEGILVALNKSFGKFNWYSGDETLDLSEFADDGESILREIAEG